MRCCFAGTSKIPPEITGAARDLFDEGTDFRIDLHVA